MHSRRSQTQLVLLFLLFAVAGPLTNCCLAQAAPRSPGIEITSTTTLTDAQRSELKTFISYWITVFLDPKSTPDKIEAARNALAHPLQVAQTVSPVFRVEYSSLLAPELEKVIDRGKDNQHAAINAIIVMSNLGTERAMAAMLSRCDQQNPAKVPWQIRLHAVIACKNLVKSPTVDSKKALDTAKRMRDVAKIEDKPLILLRLFEAIDATDNNNLKAEQTASARMYLVDALVGVAERIAKAGVAGANANPSPLIEPATLAVKLIRDKYISDRVTQPERDEIAAKMGPALGQLLSIARDGWNSAQADPETQKTFGLMVAQSDAFLTIIDTKVRGAGKSPQTKLKDAWNEHNKDKFDADVKLWLNALSDPAYAKQPN